MEAYANMGNFQTGVVTELTETKRSLTVELKTLRGEATGGDTTGHRTIPSQAGSKHFMSGSRKSSKLVTETDCHIRD